jgi:hypothetical protein
LRFASTAPLHINPYKIPNHVDRGPANAGLPLALADTGSHACAAGAHTRASTKARVAPLLMIDPLLTTGGSGARTERLAG